ncbi:MAG TPA: proline racemase family protein [Thermoanaerobaculia bacterium]|nr:proline racemase family protein [Thermoanaerobaculia bacterium]
MMRVVDSHTAGQPTRVIVEGAPDLGTSSVAEQRERLRTQFDRFRSAVVGEPRGSDVLVGAMLCKSTDPSCETGVIFFDNSGYLDISVHGVIGLVVTLEYLGRFGTGAHKVETPAGIVTVEIHPIGDISVQNVASFRHKKDVRLSVNGLTFAGDVAWGGSWCFLVNDHREEISSANVERLTALARAIRSALAEQKITGPNGEEIADVAFFGPPQRRDANSKNFVLRSGRSYRRAPGGTALSAKLACLHADGAIAEGQTWRQESIVGTVFDGSVSIVDNAVRPTIRSTAHVTAESMLIVDERDPYCWGLS